MNPGLHHPPVVVGVDAAHTSDPALHWAIEEASTRHIPIHLVSAWSPGYDLDTLGLSTEAVEDHCRAVLEAAQAQISAIDPGITVTTAASVGPATPALVDASRHADTVVVGSRGRGTVRALLLGATSLEIAAHACCPVVVVRGGDPLRGRHEHVVVGVDGSAGASDAIAYAFAYASAHTSRLTVLHAFQIELIRGVIAEMAAEESASRLVQEELALTSEAVAGWQEKYPEVQVETVTVRDQPVQALVAASTGADLVVVGGRRRGPWGSALLGAVGHGVLHHAHSPVAVVRPQPVTPPVPR